MPTDDLQHPIVIRVSRHAPRITGRRNGFSLIRICKIVINLLRQFLDRTEACHLFVFLNKRRDRIKILYWDRDGLAVWAKRLERGTFRVPQATAGRVEMTTADLAALLAGIDLNTARRRLRYTRPLIPLKNSEDFAPTTDHVST